MFVPTTPFEMRIARGVHVSSSALFPTKIMPTVKDPLEKRGISYKTIRTDPVTGEKTETTYSSTGVKTKEVRYSPYVKTAPVTGDALPGPVADLLTDDSDLSEATETETSFVSAGLGGSLPILLAVAVGAYFLLSRK